MAAALATTDICDAYPGLLESGDLRILYPVFKIYGRSQAFSGPIATLKVFEDNTLIKELIETRGDGRVLVIDGGGSMKCALMGGETSCDSAEKWLVWYPDKWLH